MPQSPLSFVMLQTSTCTWKESTDSILGPWFATSKTEGGKRKLRLIGRLIGVTQGFCNESMQESQQVQKSPYWRFIRLVYLYLYMKLPIKHQLFVEVNVTNLMGMGIAFRIHSSGGNHGSHADTWSGIPQVLHDRCESFWIHMSQNNEKTCSPCLYESLAFAVDTEVA